MTLHDFDVTMADSTVAFGYTMRMNDLGGEDFTRLSCAAIVPIPEELAITIEDELKASSGTITDTDMGTYHLLPRPIGTHNALSTQVTIRSSLVPIHTQDTHDRTLRAIRVRKIPDTASTAVEVAAVR